MILFPMTSSYVSHWRHLHAAREILANAVDAEKAGATREYSYSHNRAKVLTTGLSIGREAFFLGESSKRGTASSIGQFGEGLTLAMLVLAREGRTPRVESSGVVYSAEFSGGLLRISEHNKGHVHDAVQVSWQCSKSEWDEALAQFCTGNTPAYEDYYHGQLFTQPALKGQVFVKGVRVHTDARAEYGYNLYNVELTRDRDAPRSYDMQYAQRNILLGASHNGVFDTSKLLSSDASDLVAFVEGAQYDSALAAAIEEAWELKHGDKIPIYSMEQAERGEALGLRTHMVNPSIAKALRNKTFEKAYAERAATPCTAYNRSDLSTDEMKIFDESMDLLKLISSRVPQVTVVEFPDKTVLGRHESAPGEKYGHIQLSRQVLKSLSDTVQTLVHEVAHDWAPDATHTHYTLQTTLLSQIIEKLLR